MGIFTGEHEHTIDDKGRVIIPTSYRDDLAGGVFLSRGMDECIWLFPLGVWQTISSRLRQGPSFAKGARRVERRIFSGTEATVDKQGRLLIPASLREHAGLQDGGGIVIAGVKNRLELWNPDRWKRMLEADEEAVEAALEELDL